MAAHKNLFYFQILKERQSPAAARLETQRMRLNFLPSLFTAVISSPLQNNLFMNTFKIDPT